MSAHNAGSPVPRSASVGPNGPLPTPTGGPPLVNGVGTGNVSQPTGSTGAGGGASQMSQQNLNQIVIDYLNKKGYTRTEAVLRAESANQEIPKDMEARPTPQGPPNYFQAYGRLERWASETLDTYKPEVQRLLWPMFVYSYLALVQGYFSKDSYRFCGKYKDDFVREHEYDLRQLEAITLPEHTKDDNIATVYRESKYRLSLSTAAFHYFMQFLESLPKEQYKLFITIVEANLDLRAVERAADDRFSFAAVILRGEDGQDTPLEDEGIPGHKPGNAVSSTDPNVGNNLAQLRLGKLAMDKETEEDVRAELMDLDSLIPPTGELSSLEKTHELVNIKQEDEDEGPNRTELPFPAATSRDVNMEVTKIRENRDRLKIDARTGGIGPGVSVCMYTFHNTYDSVNCMDFSGDNKLVAAGMAESYIRVWTMDGSPLGPAHGGQPQASQRLIGHSGPVYSVAFAPAAAKFSEDAPDADVKWLLSCSADGTIRLWNLDLWQQMVIYKGHIGPVWSVSWGPYGHYFVSGGMDKTARIWMTDRVRQARLLAGHDSDVEAVAWHPNSAYVFTASCDKTVRMWALNNGSPVRMFTGHTSPITALACSRNGKLLASADDSGSIFIWDLGPGRSLKKMRGHGKGGVWSLSWSVESNVLVSGGADNTVRVWDVTGPAKEPAANKSGDPGKPDAASTAAVGVNLASAGGAKKGRKDAVVTADQISAYLTKSTPVYTVKMTNMNLAIAGGAYLPELSK